MHGQHSVKCVDKIHVTYNVRNCYCMPVENCYSRLPLMGMCIYIIRTIVFFPGESVTTVEYLLFIYFVLSSPCMHTTF